MTQPYPAQPFIKTPASDLGAFLGGSSMLDIAGRQCKRFEWNYANCINTYGIEKGFEKCRDFYDDVYECVYRTKQRKRAELIEKEREKQYKEGKIKERYINDIQLDKIYKLDV